MARLYLPVPAKPGETGRAEPADWPEAFPFLRESGHVISLVGGGGKTTLMYALARQFCALGRKTLVTTTTHIQRPREQERARTAAEARELWSRGTFAVIGSDMPEEGRPEGAAAQSQRGGAVCKLAAPEKALLAECMAEADAVLIEADGARHLPCKAPAFHEPVLLPESDIVLGVAGVSAAGHPLDEVCFRWEAACALLGIGEDHPVDAAVLADLLISPRGTRKGAGGRAFYAVLNQCDNEKRLRTALEAAALAEWNGIVHAVPPPSTRRSAPDAPPDRTA